MLQRTNKTKPKVITCPDSGSSRRSVPCAPSPAMLFAFFLSVCRVHGSICYPIGGQVLVSHNSLREGKTGRPPIAEHPQAANGRRGRQEARPPMDEAHGEKVNIGDLHAVRALVRARPRQAEFAFRSSLLFGVHGVTQYIVVSVIEILGRLTASVCTRCGLNLYRRHSRCRGLTSGLDFYSMHSR